MYISRFVCLVVFTIWRSFISLLALQKKRPAKREAHSLPHNAKQGKAKGLAVCNSQTTSPFSCLIKKSVYPFWATSYLPHGFFKAFVSPASPRLNGARQRDKAQRKTFQQERTAPGALERRRFGIAVTRRKKRHSPTLGFVSIVQSSFVLDTPPIAMEVSPKRITLRPACCAGSQGVRPLPLGLPLLTKLAR